MPPPAIVRLRHLLLGDRELPVPATVGEKGFAGALVDSLTDRGVTIGDTVLVGLESPLPSEDLAVELAGNDIILRRSEDVWDMYDSRLGHDLLRACGTDARAHHTQVRACTVDGHAVVQLAVYPQPLALAGVRMWCDPALVVVVVGVEGFEPLLARLRRVQPLWERIRAHHGIPLLTQPHPSLAVAYPVPHRPQPLTPAQFAELGRAVDLLQNERTLDELVYPTSSPQRIVERMLVARRELQRHDDRITQVLQHAHGSIRLKYEALDELMAVVFPDEQGPSAYHLTAPHRHLMDGFLETRSDVRDLATHSSETASLVVTATVGRLLDRSEANKMTGTAVGAALAIIAVVSTFTGIASIPADRSAAFLVRLAGWVGFGGLLIASYVFLLAWVANRPAIDFRPVPRRIRRAVGVGVLGAALVSFVYGATHVGVLWVALAAAAVVVVSLTYAALNDFR